MKQGALNGVDVIVGTVADERTALDGAPGKEMEIPAFHAYWKKQLGDDMYASYSFEKLYPATTKLDGYRQHLKAQADLLLEQNRIAGSLLSAKNPGSKVYVFYFDHPTPGRDREYYGSWHSSDLWYTFNSLRNEPGQRQWSPYDFELAEQASSLWANFIRTRRSQRRRPAGLAAEQPIQQGRLSLVRREIDRLNQRLAVFRHLGRRPQRPVPRLPDEILRSELTGHFQFADQPKTDARHPDETSLVPMRGGRTRHDSGNPCVQ